MLVEPSPTLPFINGTVQRPQGSNFIFFNEYIHIIMIHEAQNDCILKAIAPARASGMGMICHNTAPLFVTNG